MEFAQLLLQLHSIAVPQWIMEKILIRYEGNRSTRYNEMSASRIRREKNVRGPLKIGEYIGGGGRREIVPCILYFCTHTICFGTRNPSGARTLAMLP